MSKKAPGSRRCPGLFLCYDTKPRKVIVTLRGFLCDLLKKGDIVFIKGGYKEVLKLSFPAVISMISHSVMSMTDTIMVGRLGASEIAAVGLANIVLFTIYALFIGSIEITETFVSQSYGAGQKNNCVKTAWHGLYLSILFGLLVLPFAPLSEPLFALFSASNPVSEIGASYLGIRLFGGLFFLSSIAFASFFVGVQDTKTPMKISIVANVVNVTMDYGLIFGAWGLPQLGTDGAAMATVLANLVSVILFVWHFFGRKMNQSYGTRIFVRLRKAEIVRILKVGFPFGVEILLRMGSFLIFSLFIGRAGDDQLAASQICIQIIRFSFMPGNGLAIATTCLVGKYIGAKDLNAAARAVRSSLVIGSVYAVVLATLFLLLPRPLVSLFSSNGGVIETCTKIMFLAAFLQMFDIIAIVVSGALRGAGDTKWLMKVSLTFSWLFGLPLAIFLCTSLGLGAFGAWMGLTMETVIVACIYYTRFQQGRWKQIRL